MKKTLTLILAGAMCFSVVAMAACEEEQPSQPDQPIQTPVDPEGPSAGTNPEAPSTGEDPQDDSAKKQGYLLSAFNDLASAKTIRFTQTGEFTMSVTQSGTTTTDSSQFSFDYTLAQTQTGVDVMFKATFNDNGVKTEETRYLIDNVLYTYDSEEGAYVAAYAGFDTQDLSSLMQTPTQEELTALTAELLPLLDAYGTLTETGYSVSWNYNALVALNSLIYTINMIDESKVSVGDLINTALSLAGSDLTYTALLDMLKPLGSMTTKQALAALNEQLKPYNITVDDIKNELLSAQAVKDLLSELERQSGMPGLALMLQQNSVEELLSSFGMLNTTFDQILALLGAADGSAETVTVASLVETLKTMLAQITMEEAGIELPALDGMAVTRAVLAAKAELGDEGVRSLTASADFAAIQVVDSVTANYGLKLDLSLTELSDTSVVIALPAQANVVLNTAIRTATAELLLRSDGTGMLYVTDGGYDANYYFNYTVTSTANAPVFTLSITISGAELQDEPLFNAALNELLQNTLTYSVTVDVAASSATLPSLPVTLPAGAAV